MKPEPVTLADIRFVLANLSEQNKSEQVAYAISTEDLFKHLAKLHADGRSECVRIDDEVAAIFGVVKGFTWFIATEAYFALGKRGIRYARDRLAEFRQAEGPLISVSRSPHPAAARWFKALGFVEKPVRSVDRERVFVYQ